MYNDEFWSVIEEQIREELPSQFKEAPLQFFIVVVMEGGVKNPVSADDKTHKKYLRPSQGMVMLEVINNSPPPPRKNPD